MSLLKQGMEQRDAAALEKTISFSQWVASIYRQGGTPSIDPRRGLTLSLEFARENKLIVDLDLPTYEPRWSVPAGDRSLLVLVMPPEGEPYRAHLYLKHEPSAWRFTGILTRIPYYDAPPVAAVLADPLRYQGREFLYVGEYVSPSRPPQDAGQAPEGAAFVLDTYSGALWVTMLDAPHAVSLPGDADSRQGQLVRVFGTVRLENGIPYLEADSAEFIEPSTWTHVRGRVVELDAADRAVVLETTPGSQVGLKLAETTLIRLPDGTRGTMSDLRAGQQVDATGVPQVDGRVLAEELFIGE